MSDGAGKRADDDRPAGDERATGDDRLRDRVPGNRLKLWLLLDASRWGVAAAALATIFLTLVVLGSLDPVGLRQAVASGDPVETTFQALATAIVTGVTLVVTINQLVLSQELGAAGDQRDRMEGAMEFRREVGDLTGSVPPADPAAFLEALVATVADRAETLESAARGVEDPDAREAVVEYARWIHEGRRLRERVDDGAGETPSALANLVDALELFGPAREHLKTLYFQWELIDLSRAVVYAAVPALLTALSTVLFVADPGTIAGTVLGVDALVVVVAAAATISLLPFALLLSFVVRIATVAKPTLAIGPFVLRNDQE